MILEHTIRYDRQLVITTERLSELNDLIIKYCQYVEYKAKLENGLSVTFDSFDELREFNNIDGKAIEVLRVLGRSVRHSTSSSDDIIEMSYYNDSDTKIDVIINNNNDINRVGAFRCDMTFKDVDKQIVIEQMIDDFLRTACEGQKAYDLCRWCAIILPFSLIAYFYINAFGYNVDKSEFLLCCIIGLGIAYAIIISLNKWFFHVIEFAWGEGLNRYIRRCSLRSNVFWCIIVGLIIGILAPVIFKIFRFS